MKNVYPVIFTQTEKEILIEVPDMEILTEADTIEEAVEMARDAIGLKAISLEDDSIQIPCSSNIDDISIKNGTFAEEGRAFISLVDIDLQEYRRKTDNKAVRRNVTLPNWLNQNSQ